MDTNIAVHLRDGDDTITAKVSQLGDGLLISIVSRLELENGVYRVPSEAGLRRRLLDAMLPGLTVLPFDETCADAYHAIIASAGYSRRKMLDRMIAAQALVHRATLVTRNADDFRDVPGLALLEW